MCMWDMYVCGMYVACMCGDVHVYVCYVRCVRCDVCVVHVICMCIYVLWVCCVCVPYMHVGGDACVCVHMRGMFRGS